MTSEQPVLIVSTVVDLATDEVVRRLQSRSTPVVRLNTEDFPFYGRFAAAIDGPEQQLFLGGVALPNPSAVWYRRLRSPSRPEKMDPGTYEFCLQENRAAVVGSLQSLKARWMSHPAAIWQSEFKPVQIAAAREIGLSVPRTCITNDPELVRDFASAVRRLVAKPVRSGHVVRDGQEYAIFTSEVRPEDLVASTDIELSPCIYQELIEKTCDLRVTVVGRQVFAAAIHSQCDPDARIDWRQTSDPDLPHSRVDLPHGLTEKLLLLMARLKLTFGAIDLVRTPDDQYVFLEVNPSGQWLWLDDKLEFGISEAVASWLAGERQ